MIKYPNRHIFLICIDILLKPQGKQRSFIRTENQGSASCADHYKHQGAKEAQASRSTWWEGNQCAIEHSTPKLDKGVIPCQLFHGLLSSFLWFSQLSSSQLGQERQRKNKGHYLLGWCFSRKVLSPSFISSASQISPRGEVAGSNLVSFFGEKLQTATVLRTKQAFSPLINHSSGLLATGSKRNLFLIHNSYLLCNWWNGKEPLSSAVNQDISIQNCRYQF